MSIRQPGNESDERGAALIEYTLLIALISLASLALLTFLGGSVRDVFVAIGERIVTAAIALRL